jgi:hypothetical protein
VSPVDRRQGHTGRALAVAVAGVVLALALAFGVALLANRGDIDVRLGDEVFEAGDARDRAAQIAENGPALFQDVAGGDRHIVLQHLATSPREGWVALATRPPGTPARCNVRWEGAGGGDDGGDPGDGVFRLLDPDGEVSGPCDGREFPADGTGLPQYPVELRDGQLHIDINAAERTDGDGPG